LAQSLLFEGPQMHKSKVGKAQQGKVRQSKARPSNRSQGKRSEGKAVRQDTGKTRQGKRESKARATSGRMEAIRRNLGEEPLQFVSKEMRYVPTRSLTITADPELVASVHELTKSNSRISNPDAQHFLSVVKSLLLYAVGELDQSHNLVLPLSWPSSTPFGGPPIRGSAAAQDATYVHAMLHRQEGQFVGQEGGGTLGWDNAAFWFSQVGQHPLYPAVLAGAHGLAAGNAVLEKHVRSHGKTWKPSLFLNLCQEVQGSEGLEATFCRALMNLEWHLLIDHVWAKA